MKTIVALLVLAAMGYVSWWSTRRRLARYYSRRCVGRAWRRRFPDATNEEIRDFLRLFVAAFLLEKKRALSFSPEDKVMDVYRTIYPSPIMADALETVTFARECERRYGVNITRSWGEASTLGDIFSTIRKNA